MLVRRCCYQAAACLWLYSITGQTLGADGFSGALGTGALKTEVNIARMDFLWDWDKRLFPGTDWLIAGYWEANIGYLQDNRTENDRFVEVGVAGTLRYTPLRLTESISSYMDLGIGVHLLAKSIIGHDDLSTKVQFSPSAGIGLLFGKRHRFEFGYRFLHLSNGGIKEPNPGLDFHMVRYVYRF